MNPRRVTTLYRKEMLDLLRDRRTLITMVLVPMLMGPMVTAGMAWYMRTTRAAAKVEKYKVAMAANAPLPGLAETLTAAGFKVVNSSDPRASVETAQTQFGIAPKGNSLKLFSDDSDMKVTMAGSRIREVLSRFREARVRMELERSGVPVTILDSYKVERVNVAKPRKMAGSTIGGLIAFVLLIFLFNGAMYSAVDMTAGEKERRTMEILLASPASRQEIVGAKVLAAITSAFSTAILSVLSYVAAFKISGEKMGSDLGTGDMMLPTDAATLGLVVLALLPIAILSACLSVALATPARSTREGMSLVTPMLFVIMFLGSVTFMPDLQASPSMVFVPIANFAKVMRQLLIGEWSWSQYALAFGANLVYAFAAMVFAINRFNNEKILFRS